MGLAPVNDEFAGHGRRGTARGDHHSPEIGRATDLAPLTAGQPPEILLSPTALPAYAVRTTIRMLAALVACARRQGDRSDDPKPGWG